MSVMPKRKNQDIMLALFWGTTLKKVITTITTVALCITATGAAWAVLELPVPASKVYVHEYVKPVQMTQAQQAVAIDRFLLFQLQDSLDKARHDPAAATSPVVQERIRELQEQIQQTSARIRKASGG